MYYYCVVKCELELNEDESALEPALQFPVFSFVAVKEGGTFVQDRLSDLTLDGTDVMALIHVKREDEQLAKKPTDNLEV